MKPTAPRKPEIASRISAAAPPRFDFLPSVARSASRALNRCAFFVALLVGVLARAANADVSSDFEQANRLYEQGRYAEAAAAYDKLIAAGNVSTALYFNRGNASFKLNQIGRAIGFYRQSQTLSPRDADVRANLQFARNQVAGIKSALTERRWRWLSDLTTNEWAGLTAVALWLWMLTLAATQWRPQWRLVLRRYTVLLGLACGLLGVCATATLRDYLHSRTAIVTVREAVVHNGPLDESPAAFAARDGAELSILDQTREWLQVRDGQGRLGWLRRDSALVFTPNGGASAGS